MLIFIHWALDSARAPDTWTRKSTSAPLGDRGRRPSGAEVIIFRESAGPRA
jgi:hypothetical protein